MKLSDLPVLAIFKTLYLAVSTLAAAALTKLVIRFVILFVELDFLSASIVRMAALLLFTYGIWGYLNYKEGYRNGYFSLSESLAAYGVTAVLHVALGAIFRFNPWVSGATRHISGFLSLGGAYNSEERIAEIPIIAGILTAIGMSILLTVLGSFAEYAGARKRLRDREELTGEAK